MVDIGNLETVIAVGAAPTMAVVASSILAGRSAKKAQKATADQAEAASQAQLGILRAQEDAAKAQKQALQAATELVRVARVTDARLEGLKTVADATQTVANATHAIVNSDRTTMLRVVADLRRELARINPGDPQLAEAAAQAEVEASAAEAAQQAGTGAIPPPPAGPGLQ